MPQCYGILQFDRKTIRMSIIVITVLSTDGYNLYGLFP